jgi:hypothetical protein
MEARRLAGRPAVRIQTQLVLILYPERGAVLQPSRNEAHSGHWKP